MSSLLDMASHLGSLLLLVSVWVTVATALNFDVCADFNTASMDGNTSIFQTNGLCHDFCIEKNQAYAITQEKLCWCSDFTPARNTEVDNGKCNVPCPAYPSEMCGGKDVFGYIALGNVSPSGTKGAPSPPPSPTPSAAPPPAPSPKPNESSTDSETPLTSVIQTVTAGGTIRTVTVMPTATGAVTNDPKEMAGPSPHRGGLGTGGVVGVVVSIIVGILAVAAVLFFYFRRKRQAYQDDPSVRGSSSGIMGSRPEMAGAPGSPGSTGNRSSTLQIDPRMDPFKQGLYARSGSHESANTLRDEQDYSRRIQQPKVLRATNPDPAVD